MGRFVLKRVLLMAMTLFFVTILVFVLAQVLPGDVGRSVLGPYATNQQVHLFDVRLGLYKPLPVRYYDWFKGFLVGDWGNSLLLQVPILPLFFTRLWNSTQLALVAFVIIFPLSIFVGVLAGMRENGLLDRFISTVGLSLTALPEFVTGTILIYLLAVKLRWFPITGQAPPGASLPTRIYHLLLPSFPLMFVLFGYLAQHARSGTREAVSAAYYRSAVLKGLPKRRILVSHVLPNALLPTITVVALQIGYLVGGLVVVETLFNYPGIGQLLLSSSVGKDIPIMEDESVILGALIAFCNLAADLSYSLLNPRIRLATS